MGKKEGLDISFSKVASRVLTMKISPFLKKDQEV